MRAQQGGTNRVTEHKGVIKEVIRFIGVSRGEKKS